MPVAQSLASSLKSLFTWTQALTSIRRPDSKSPRVPLVVHLRPCYRVCLEKEKRIDFVGKQNLVTLIESSIMMHPMNKEPSMKYTRDRPSILALVFCRVPIRSACIFSGVMSELELAMNARELLMSASVMLDGSSSSLVGYKGSAFWYIPSGRLSTFPLCRPLP